MAQPDYTDDQRDEACAAGVEHGPSEAARLLGIPKGTICRWMKQRGLETIAPQKLAAANESKRLRWEERRLDMAHEIGEAAEEVLTRLRDQVFEASARDLPALTTALGTLIDKAQLLTGGATSRTDSADDLRDRARRVLDQWDEVGAQRAKPRSA